MTKVVRELAPISQKTLKEQAKLREQWAKRSVDGNALLETKEKIHKWIADNVKNRVPVTKKSIHLFNRNEDSAEMSSKVQKFAHTLFGKK